MPALNLFNGHGRFGRIFGNALNGLKDAFKGSFFSGFSDLLENVAKGLLGRYTGSNLTPAEEQANEFTHNERIEAQDWTAEREDTRYQRQVADMQAAGLNPMMAAGGSPVSAASSSGGSSVSPNGGSLSDIMSLFMLKPQMELMKAQADNYKASAKEKDARADYWPARKAEALEKINLMQNQAEREFAQAMLSKANEKTVNAMREPLVNLTKAQGDQASAQATLAAAQAAYQNGLIDAGMCEQVVAKIVAETNLANKQASKADIDTAVTKLALSLQTGTYSDVVNELVEKYGWDKGTYYTILAHLKNSFDAIPLSVNIG